MLVKTLDADIHDIKAGDRFVFRVTESGDDSKPRGWLFELEGMPWQRDVIHSQRVQLGLTTDPRQRGVFEVVERNDGDFIYIAPAIDEKFAGTEISLKPARQERRYHMHFASTPDLPMHISSGIECNVKKTGFKAQLEFFSVHLRWDDHGWSLTLECSHSDSEFLPVSNEKFSTHPEVEVVDQYHFSEEARRARRILSWAETTSADMDGFGVRRHEKIANSVLSNPSRNWTGPDHPTEGTSQTRTILGFRGESDPRVLVRTSRSMLPRLHWQNKGTGVTGAELGIRFRRHQLIVAYD
ncbi:hypothetical protein B0H13DRAFT_1866219 [Mycena leptocephala]|nr:hypothetical protein B0H13DRAFT_1866219 [Mycena leptocephala]